MLGNRTIGCFAFCQCGCCWLLVGSPEGVTSLLLGAPHGVLPADAILALGPCSSILSQGAPHVEAARLIRERAGKVFVRVGGAVGLVDLVLTPWGLEALGARFSYLRFLVSNCHAISAILRATMMMEVFAPWPLLCFARR